MKIVAVYNIFNGLEIFDKSIEYTRKYVDEIIFVYQTISYRGSTNPDVIPTIEKYPDIKKYQFNPDMKLMPKDNELNKSNWMLDIARLNGADYMLFMDCDHIYQQGVKFTDAIEKATKYDISWTKMQTYYKYPTWQLDPPEDYYMPFLIKLYPHTQFIKNLPFYPVVVDPTLRINTFMNNYVFPFDDFHFHHYSMVRKDITEKFTNSPSRPLEYWQGRGMVDEWYNYNIAENPGVKYFSGRKIKLAPNYFNINL